MGLLSRREQPIENYSFVRGFNFWKNSLKLKFSVEWKAPHPNWATVNFTPTKLEMVAKLYLKSL